MQRTRLTAHLAGGLLGFTVTAAAALGDEVSVQNDSLVNGGSANICVCFAENEQAAAWLTSPCDGTLVAVQIFWKSQFGGTVQSLEDSITVYEAGTFPFPGPVMGNCDAFDLILEGPVLTDGGLNEFRYLDKNNTVPLCAPIESGQTFVVSLTFFNPNAGDIFAASVASDSSGCQPGKNAVFAIPGGWLNACALGVSGDWVIRAIVDCDVGGSGACCLSGGSCQILSSSQCNLAGGDFLGSDTLCNNSCPGACCDAGQNCEQATEAECDAQGGFFLGQGTDCAGGCNLSGACCFQPSGCLNFSAEDCMVAGGDFQGAGTSCGTTICNPIGACCLIDGTCVNNSPEDDCLAGGGAFQGHGTSCAQTSCPQPFGACCLSNGNCLNLIEDDCGVIPNSLWAGPQTECNDVPDPCDPPCPGDANGDQVVDVQDLVLVITNWGDPGGSGDVTGDNQIDVQDLVMVITNWGDC